MLVFKDSVIIRLATAVEPHWYITSPDVRKWRIVVTWHDTHQPITALPLHPRATHSAPFRSRDASRLPHSVWHVLQQTACSNKQAVLLMNCIVTHSPHFRHDRHRPTTGPDSSHVTHTGQWERGTALHLTHDVRWLIRFSWMTLLAGKCTCSSSASLPVNQLLWRHNWVRARENYTQTRGCKAEQHIRSSCNAFIAVENCSFSEKMHKLCCTGVCKECYAILLDSEKRSGSYIKNSALKFWMYNK